MDMLEDLAGCLCAQLAERDAPTCFCGVIFGQGPVATYGTNCDEDAEGNKLDGMAWVRMADLYPTSGVGDQNILPGNCNSSLGVELEIGVIRNVLVADPDDPSIPPPDSELLRVATLATEDALSMIKAVRCCASLGAKDFILGNWAPNGPLGALAGGSIRVTVAL